MVTVEKLHDVEAASVHVEVDVSFLEVRRYRLPDLHLQVQPLDLASCSVTDAPAMG